MLFRSVSFRHRGEDIVLQPPSAQKDVSELMVSATQFKRHCRKGGQVFVAVLRRIPGNSADTTDTLKSIDSKQVVADLLAEYSDVFPEDLPKGLPPKREIEHRIIEVPGSKPASRPPYRMCVMCVTVYTPPFGLFRHRQSPQGP